jgi:hypothetical protein
LIGCELHEMKGIPSQICCREFRCHSEWEFGPFYSAPPNNR